VKHFDAIHTVDRVKLAEELSKEMDKQGRSVPCFIQVNVGREPQKSGVLPEELERLCTECRNTFGLDIVGLMCVPPRSEDPTLHFSKMAQWRNRLGLEYLSMGMSTDFRQAVGCGATHIRVGEAIFGGRQTSQA
jgi:pyridoxal phosphate enzyme (YggS family)